MEKTEMRAIWDLIRTFRPGDSRLTDRRLMQAWWDALSGYSAETVRQAVLSHFRSNNFFPDLCELRLPSEAEAPGRGSEDCAEHLRERFRWLRKARSEAGIPATAIEARARGMSTEEWFSAAERAGLSL